MLNFAGSNPASVTAERLAEIIANTCYWVQWPRSAYLLIATELQKVLDIREKE